MTSKRNGTPLNYSEIRRFNSVAFFFGEPLVQSCAQ